MKPTVIVTGFGPFRSYVTNASWESVKLVEIDDVNLIKQEIEVAYEAVDKCLDHLWTKYEPVLVIHCGVSYAARGLVLESVAYSSEYRNADVRGRLPGAECQDGHCQQLCTQLNLEHVISVINGTHDDGHIKLRAQCSTDAGRYLCEYVYFHSLKRDPSRTLFIHVPELTFFSAQEIAQALAVAIKAVLDNMQIVKC
ncbi:Pyroglutamyl-peptidase 1 [Halotydeus destructor]|nr:Pyroglutamyl-peptidase 1 [Halotydeus destructor]